MLSTDSLFYTSVMVDDKVALYGMLDSGSMAFTMNESAEQKLLEAGIINDQNGDSPDMLLIACGGNQVRPKRAVTLQQGIYGCKMLVLTLIVSGQHDEFIVGTNVIKHIIQCSKQCDLPL